jgi:hypothetical protein
MVSVVDRLRSSALRAENKQIYLSPLSASPSGYTQKKSQTPNEQSPKKTEKAGTSSSFGISRAAGWDLDFGI